MRWLAPTRNQPDGTGLLIWILVVALSHAHAARRGRFVEESPSPRIVIDLSCEGVDHGRTPLPRLCRHGWHRRGRQRAGRSMSSSAKAAAMGASEVLPGVVPDEARDMFRGIGSAP